MEFINYGYADIRYLILIGVNVNFQQLLGYDEQSKSFAGHLQI